MTNPHLNTETVKPIHEYGGFMSKTEVQISPDRNKMAGLSGGQLYFVNISTGKVVDLISPELIGGTMKIVSFDINWEDNIAELDVTPIKGNEEILEKVYIDMKSHRIIDRDTREMKDKIVFSFSDEIRTRRILTATSSKRYIQDRKGNIRIYDRQTGKLLERLDHTLFERAPGQPVVFYISPDGKLLFYRKDGQISGEAEYVSWLCVMDMKTRQIIKTLHFPQKVVTVLFGE